MEGSKTKRSYLRLLLFFCSLGLVLFLRVPALEGKTVIFPGMSG